jgi:hypothetical protein
VSGGSMNYLYSKVLHCADFSVDTPERKAFAEHLKLVAQALHDIEWVDSGDYGPGDEDRAIRACLPMDDTALLRRCLEEFQSFESGTGGLYQGEFAEIITALRARLGKKV